MNIKKIIKEEMDDFEWLRDIPSALPISAEEGNNFILIADVIEDLPCKPQELMFNAGYRWAGDMEYIHGDPIECKDQRIYNEPYILIPYQGKVNYYNGHRKFGMVGGMDRSVLSIDYVKKYIDKWNPTIILWSELVNKEPDFVLDDSIN